MPEIYWIPISFFLIVSLLIFGVYRYTKWYYNNRFGIIFTLKDAFQLEMEITLKDIIPYRFHCKLGMHSPVAMVHSVLLEKQEDVCSECGKVLAKYKTIKVKPKNTSVKRGLF